MSRIKPLEKQEIERDQRGLLEEARSIFGSTPNFLHVLAHSPAALRAYLGQVSFLSNGSLGPQMAAKLALTVSGANGSDYCASAHSALASNAGVSKEALAESLHGEAREERTAAVLGFARLVVARRGQVDDEDVAALRAAGLTDEELIEVLAHIGMTLFTNYLNQVAQTGARLSARECS